MSVSATQQTVTESNALVVRVPLPRRRVERPISYRDVFAVAEFRALFLADLCSLIGDQIAAVAVAVLLYQSSGSPLLAALGYATAYVPWLLGGPMLAAWAERFPGKTVMVCCDLARAGLIGLAAIPGLPTAAVGLLVLAAALLAPPFEAARSALLPQILTGERYPVGMSIRDAVHQSAQLIGFAVGGALVLAVTAQGSLALDAVTFTGSALALQIGLTLRAPVRADEPATTRSRRTIDLQTRSVDVLPEPHRPRSTTLWQETLAGLTAVRSNPLMYSPLLLGMVGAAYAIVPEAIAPSYAATLGRGPRVVGLIMAAVAAGSVVGGLAMGRLATPTTRARLMYPLALVGAVPLLLVVFKPGLELSLTLFALTGLASSYQVCANTMFAQNVPSPMRTRAFGIAISGLYAGQAAAIVLAGLAAQFFPASDVVAGAGLLGGLGVAALFRSGAATIAQPRGRHPRGRHREH
jgi:MFS family permease